MIPRHFSEYIDLCAEHYPEIPVDAWSFDGNGLSAGMRCAYFEMVTVGSCCGSGSIQNYRSANVDSAFLEKFIRLRMKAVRSIPYLVHCVRWYLHPKLARPVDGAYYRPFRVAFQRVGKVIATWRNPLHTYSLIDLIQIVPDEANPAYLWNVEKYNLQDVLPYK